MRFYWRMAALPELQGLRRPQQRQLWRACLPTAMRDRRVWWGFAGLVATVLIGGLLAEILPLPLLHTTAGPWRSGWLALWALIGGIGYEQVLMHVMRPLLAAARQAAEPKHHQEISTP